MSYLLLVFDYIHKHLFEIEYNNDDLPDLSLR